MRLAALFVVVAVLAGCDKVTPVSPEARPGGRYSGVGVFDAGRVWEHIKRAEQATAEGVATLADDEHIIVVEDSITGEVRQCGDHSGYCVAIQP